MKRLKGKTSSLKDKALFCLPLLVFLPFLGSCDLELPTELKPPRWHTTLNIPLLNKSYPVSDLATSDSLIQISGDSMYIQFGDSLGSVTLGKENFYVPTGGNPFSFSHSQNTIDLPPLQESIGPFQADIPREIIIPDPYNPFSGDSIILKQIWDGVADTIKINDTTTVNIGPSYQREIENYFSSYKLVIDSGSTFRTVVTNNTPGVIDTVQMALLAIRKDGSINFLANHFKRQLQPFTSFDTTTDLSGKFLDSLSIWVINRAIFDTADSNLRVPPGTKPHLSYQSDVNVALKEVRGILKPQSLLDLEDSTPLPTDNRTKIVEGALSFSDPDTNRLNISMENRFPFNVAMRLEFFNIFTPDSVNLSIDTSLVKNRNTSILLDLSGHHIRSKIPGEVLSEMEYTVQVGIAASSDTSVFPIGGGELGSFNGGIVLNDMQFDSLEGIFELMMPVPPTAFEIPQGIAGIGIAEPRMTLSVSNEIDLNLSLGLVLTGQKDTETLQMAVYPELASPAAGNDSAITEIILDHRGMSVSWDGVTQANQNYNEYPTIVDLINMGPDSFLVQPTASVQGQGTLVAGKKLSGRYEVMALFKLMPDTQVFIPLVNNPLAPWDSSTAASIRETAVQGQLNATIYSRFPLAGRMSLLFSDSVIFPENRSAKALSDAGVDTIINDTLHFSDGSYSWVDTLFRIFLPRPEIDSISGAISRVCDTSFISVVNYPAIERLSENKTHYIIPKITLFGSNQAVWIRSSDYVHIQAFIGFTLRSEGIFGNDSSEAEQ
jgi:hypothetical protein